jgi:hypothetical protein
VSLRNSGGAERPSGDVTESVQKRLILNRGRSAPTDIRCGPYRQTNYSWQVDPTNTKQSPGRGLMEQSGKIGGGEAARQSARRSVVHCGGKIVVEVQSCGRFFHDSRTNKVVAEVFVAAAFFCIRFKQWRQRGDNRIAIDVATM